MTFLSLIREKIEEIWRWESVEREKDRETEAEWKRDMSVGEKLEEIVLSESNMAGCDMWRAGRGNWTDID